jgi:hypothetical protein
MRFLLGLHPRIPEGFLLVRNACFCSVGKACNPECVFTFRDGRDWMAIRRWCSIPDVLEYVGAFRGGFCIGEVPLAEGRGERGERVEGRSGGLTDG